MKKYAILSILLFFVSVTFAQEAKVQSPVIKADGPVLTLEKTTHDFGDIYQGDVVEHTFKFTNTGNQPLMITNIQPTCGCTTPQWPRDPIMPGGKGEIKVGFNSTGKMNKQTKTLPIISNSVVDAAVTFTTNVLDRKPQ
ncbi:MAG TPA: DUF1573 domain-containing protein [Cyclobacteriaceae bacterium]|nr:DUF1573 domain-containing protein [Cyclobacteriaceae bacterium]